MFAFAASKSIACTQNIWHGHHQLMFYLEKTIGAHSTIFRNRGATPAPPVKFANCLLCCGDGTEDPGVLACVAVSITPCFVSKFSTLSSCYFHWVVIVLLWVVVDILLMNLTFS